MTAKVGGFFKRMDTERMDIDIRNRQFDPMSSEEWILRISDNSFTKDELCWLYCYGLVYRELLADPENLQAVTEAMLDNGMDPNQLVTDALPNDDPEDNYYLIPLISATRITDDKAAAESLKMLFERGGDPNTMHLFGDFRENVYEFYIEDEFANGPDLDGGTFYGLLLCKAYGGRYHRGQDSFTMLIDAPVSIFKEYEKYWYEYIETEPWHYNLYVVEKGTGRRVAKFY